MTFDLYARKPKKRAHLAFQNVAWRPVWDYCVTRHRELAEKIHSPIGVEGGHYNGGAYFKAEDALALGNQLNLDAEEGVLHIYARLHADILDNLPDQSCHLCQGTGVRTDSVGMRLAFHDKALEDRIAQQVGRTYGFCNACLGLGTLKHPARDYYIDPDHILLFADFACQSGGFEIK